MGSQHTKHAQPPQTSVKQRSITPPPQQQMLATELPGMSIVDTASTASAGAAERRQRAQKLADRNPALAFQLPVPAPDMTTIGYIYISSSRLVCSNDIVRQVVWDHAHNSVDRDITEVIQLLCETTLRRARGGYQAILQKHAHTYYFVSHYSLTSTDEIRISVRAVDPVAAVRTSDV